MPIVKALMYHTILLLHNCVCWSGGGVGCLSRGALRLWE